MGLELELLANARIDVVQTGQCGNQYSIACIRLFGGARVFCRGLSGQNGWENEGSHLQAARSKNSEIKNIKVIAF